MSVQVKEQTEFQSMNNSFLSKVKDFFQVIWGNKQSRVGLIILTIFILMAILGPILLDAPAADYRNRLAAPSMQHLLGTDYAGKDTLTQFILGAKDVLLVAVYAAMFSILFACTIGIVSGLVGGKVDDFIMLITNIILTMPTFPVTMVLTMIISVDNLLVFGLVLSLWSWAGLAKSIRAQVLVIKHKDFIEASRVLGINMFNIITKDIIPNIISYIAVNFIAIMRSAIMASVGLMILGLVPFKGNHWGIMIQMAMTQTGALLGSSSIIYFLTPVVGILLFQLGCYLFANGLDGALNPRLR
ncbi:MAG: ABC transporter permease [Clostridium celatum]|nr:ABC transporter permease [Clostridium celatum]